VTTIRRATLSDARDLARIAEETFRSTFGPTNTASDMDLHCRENYSESMQAAEISDPDTVSLLCENDGSLIGFAQVRWHDAPACVSGRSPGEIHRFYVIDAWHGKGIAQTLMDASIEELRRRGSDVVWLGVWESNPKAIAFYKKFGFVEVGEHIYQVGTDPQRDIIMARAVT
jgi:ribosomal protein S18 acetylase RimI-like enzyme